MEPVDRPVYTTPLTGRRHLPAGHKPFLQTGRFTSSIIDVDYMSMCHARCSIKILNEGYIEITMQLECLHRRTVRGGGVTRKWLFSLNDNFKCISVQTTFFQDLLTLFKRKYELEDT